MPDYVADMMSEMLRAVVDSGTASRLRRLYQVPGALAGKTGTAQVRRISAAERATGVRGNDELERRLRDHALFVGYAPVDNPKYAIAVVVEHGGGGSSSAAPVAKDIMREAFLRDSGRAPVVRSNTAQATPSDAAPDPKSGAG